MITIFFIIWILCGILSIFLAFNTTRKDWYDSFGDEYWNNGSESALHFLLIVSPIFVLGGLISFIIVLIFTPRKHWSLWFKLPK